MSFVQLISQSTVVSGLAREPVFILLVRFKRHPLASEPANKIFFRDLDQPLLSSLLLASHIVISTYGFWLPNDPRGSWSDWVRSYELFLAGGSATKTDDRRSLAKRPHDPRQRVAVKRMLKRNPVQLSSVQARQVVQGFKRAADESNYAIFALAVLPDHAHAVIGHHNHSPQQIMGHLKARSTRALLEAGLHPFAADVTPGGRVPQVWAHRGWTVFLDTAVDVRRTIRYVENNPLRAGLRRQTYSFLTPFR